MPGWVRERGLALYLLAERDIPVLDVTYDTLLVEPAGSTHGVRVVRFSAPILDLSVTVTTVVHGDEVDAVVLARPAAAAGVHARCTDGRTFRSTVDTFGAAQFAGLPTGIVSFYGPGDDGDRRWRTAWLHY